MVWRAIPRLKRSAEQLLRRRSVRNFSGVVVSNLIATAISLVLAIIVPKLVSVTDYSYWQLYIFYISYVGILHFGITDGIYLRYGGEYYEKLNKKLIGSQFWLLFVLQIVVSMVVILIAQLYMRETERAFIFTLIGVGLVLVNVRTFLQMLLQTTNRMVDFSKNLIFEKIIYAGLIIVSLVMGYKDFHYLLYADLIAKFLMLVLLMRTCSDVIFNRLSFNNQALHELTKNLNAGSRLMLANLASILIIGIVRLVVEMNWDIKTFGQLALILATTNLVLIFMTAAGVVVYPIIKRASFTRMKIVYGDMRKVLITVMLGFLMLYFPMCWLLGWWLPHYSQGLTYLALLFPLCFFEAKSQVLTNTYLKAVRKETALLTVNLSALGVSAVMACVAAFVFQSLPVTILTITISLAVKSLLSEYILSRYLGINLWTHSLWELAMVVLFIASCWYVPGWAFYIYSVVLLVYMFMTYRGFITAIRRTLINHG